MDGAIRACRLFQHVQNICPGSRVCIVVGKDQRLVSPAMGLTVLTKRGGTVESRIRTLVQDLENTENIVTAHPQCGGISNAFICLTEEEQAAASQGELGVEAMKRSEADLEGKEYKRIYTKNFFIGLEIEKKSSSESGFVISSLCVHAG